MVKENVQSGLYLGNMIQFLIVLITLVPCFSCGNGMIQEILLIDKNSKDVTPSVRSLSSNDNVVAINHIDNFDAVAKVSKHYLQKVRGYFKAPETGEYKFYSSCSGPCQIFIGQEKSANPRKIISQKEESLHNEFTRYPDQVSHTLYLEKDKLYYIEGVEKQHGGLGHLSVGVVLPSDHKVFPIAKKYLKVGDLGGLNRKEEISRNNGQDLAKQRDKMIKKLRDINDYITKLTDEVKMNPNLAKSIAAQEKGSEDSSGSSEDHLNGKGALIITADKGKASPSAKKDDSLHDANNQEDKEEQRKRISEGGQLKMAVEEKGLDKKTEHSQAEKGRVKEEGEQTKGKPDKNVNVFLKEKGFQGKQNFSIKGASEKGLKGEDEKDTLVAIVEKGDKENDAQKIMHGANMRTVGANANEESSGNGVKEVHGAHSHYPLHVAFTSRGPTKSMDSEPKQLVLDNEDEVNGIQIADGIGYHDHGVAAQTPVVGSYDNRLGAMHGTSKVTVEHNYVKMLKSGDKVESVHSTTKYDMHQHPAIGEEDDDDVLRLTGFAKEEISRNGNLSDSAIKKFIKTIKQKLIQSGFVRRDNMTVSNETESRQVKDEKENNVSQKSPTEDDSEKNFTQNTDLKESLKSKQQNKGKLFLYDQVVSNLLRLLKGTMEESTERRLKGTEGPSAVNEESSNGAQLRAKLLNTGNPESKERRRMLKSLHLLSSEIDNFKRILQEQKGEREAGAEEKPKSTNSDAHQITPSFEDEEKKIDFPGGSEVAENTTIIGKPEASQSEDNAVSRTKMPSSHYDASEESSKQQFGQVLEEKIKQEAISNAELSDNTAADHVEGQSQIDLQDTRAQNSSLPADVNKEKSIGTSSQSQVGRKTTPTQGFQRYQQPSGDIFNPINMYITKSSSKRPLVIEGYTGLVRKAENDNTSDTTDQLRLKDTPKEDPSDRKFSYTDALTKTVENLLTGVSVPSLFADPTAGVLATEDGQVSLDSKQINNKQGTFVSNEKVAPSRQPYSLETNYVNGGLRQGSGFRNNAIGPSSKYFGGINRNKETKMQNVTGAKKTLISRRFTQRKWSRQDKKRQKQRKNVRGSLLQDIAKGAKRFKGQSRAAARPKQTKSPLIVQRQT